VSSELDGEQLPFSGTSLPRLISPARGALRSRLSLRGPVTKQLRVKRSQPTLLLCSGLVGLDLTLLLVH